MKKAKLTSSKRHELIRERLKKNREVSIGELAQQLGVSEMTIRRDLDKLELTGQVQRTHGGAVPAERLVLEFNFGEQRRRNQRYKKRIAQKAMELVGTGNTIILDTGTTTLELAHLLRKMKGISILTPSMAAASILQFSPEIETILLGGVIREGNPDLTGVITESVLDMFSVDIAFQGVDGIGLDGHLYTADMRIANVDRKMRQRAEKVYILADSSKIGKKAFAVNGHIGECDALITDERITDKQKRSLEKQGAKIIIAN